MPDINALIVDDSMSARFALNRSLQPYNMTVDQAKSGEEGVSCATEKAYDVIFMDHVLPGLDGLHATEQIRQLPGYAGIPIIMCTSNDTDDYRARAQQRGATDVLCKPPDAQRLDEAMQRHVLNRDATVDASTDTVPQQPIESPAEPLSVQPQDVTPETPAMSDSAQLQAIDQRLDRLETLLAKLEQHVGQMDARNKAMARAIADQAGRDLSNRLLRAVLTLKGK